MYVIIIILIICDDQREKGMFQNFESYFFLYVFLHHHIFDSIPRCTAPILSHPQNLIPAEVCFHPREIS